MELNDSWDEFLLRNLFIYPPKVGSPNFVHDGDMVSNPEIPNNRFGPLMFQMTKV